MTKAEQTLFWEGEFGNEYTQRNRLHANDRKKFFAHILEKTSGISSVCELGANSGHNLEAIQLVNPVIEATGVEVNRKACSEMAGKSRINAVCSTIQEFNPTEKFDLVFTCGVMIHLPPADLPKVYRKMHTLSQKYILINEYFNPVPVEISYRGHNERLFKRDFGGEFLDAVERRVRLVDYGFLWQRVEPAWDNTTWWLWEKI
jgi:spore coat polysaccharide biosynthesis protein SpsF